MDVLGVQVFDVIGLLFSRVVGRPAQRWRARRLARKGKVNCVLFAPSSPSVLPRRLLSGAAEISPGRLHLYDADLWVTGVELPGDAGPGEDRSDGDLLFRPPARTFTLRTHRGTVRWTVLAWQADWAVDRLGFGTSSED